MTKVIKIKEHIRHLKSGKTIKIKAYTRTIETSKEGAGDEYKKKKTSSEYDRVSKGPTKTLKKHRVTRASSLKEKYYSNEDEDKYAEWRKDIYNKDFMDFSALEKYLDYKSSQNKKEASKKPTWRPKREKTTPHQGPTKGVMEALKRRRTARAAKKSQD